MFINRYSNVSKGPTQRQNIKTKERVIVLVNDIKNILLHKQYEFTSQ